MAESRPFTSHLANTLGFLAGRLRDPAFWYVQGMVLTISAAHYLLESRVHAERYEDLHWLPVILYVFPIIYGSLRFRLEGGLLTGLWCFALTLPNILLYHSSGFEWLVEAAQLSVAVIVGMVLSRLVDHETAQRLRAEEMASQLALLHRQVTNAQEDERRRVARELHDETAQNLVLLCRHLDEAAAARRAPRLMYTKLEELRAIAEQTLNGVRRFVRDLRPSVLDDLGLVAAVEWLATDLMTRHQIDAKVVVTGSPQRLPTEAELALFRIVQESLRNVEKHAEASHVTVSITFQDARVSVVVRDDGKGFVLSPTPNHLVAGGKLGLVGMRERAQLLGGTLLVESQPGSGSVVKAELGFNRP